VGKTSFERIRMESWPFTDNDWKVVQNATHDIVNASYIEDQELVSSTKERLFVLLESLMEKYGPHPVLFETKADFTEQPHSRIELYNEAISLAQKSGIQTTTIRLSLSRVYLEDIGDVEAAKSQLSMCEKPMASDDIDEWNELKKEVERLT
jgi:hypothetical protein